MYAIAFDMRVAELDDRHAKGFVAAYAEISRALRGAGFRRIQGSVFVTDDTNLSRVTEAMVALKALSWFSPSVTDIRAFKVEDWSDFTPFFKERPAPP